MRTSSIALAFLFGSLSLSSTKTVPVKSLAQVSTKFEDEPYYWSAGSTDEEKTDAFGNTFYYEENGDFVYQDEDGVYWSHDESTQYWYGEDDLGNHWEYY